MAVSGARPIRVLSINACCLPSGLRNHALPKLTGGAFVAAVAVLWLSSAATVALWRGWPANKAVSFAVLLFPPSLQARCDLCA